MSKERGDTGGAHAVDPPLLSIQRNPSVELSAKPVVDGCGDRAPLLGMLVHGIGVFIGSGRPGAYVLRRTNRYFAQLTEADSADMLSGSPDELGVGTRIIDDSCPTRSLIHFQLGHQCRPDRRGKTSIDERLHASSLVAPGSRHKWVYPAPRG